MRRLSILCFFYVFAVLAHAQTPANGTMPIAQSSLPTSYPLSLKPQDAVIESQIRNTLAHYPLALDGKNFAALDLVFTPDAVANYSTGIGVLRGLEQIKIALEQALVPVVSQHLYGTQVIEIEKGGRTARALTYLTASQFGQGTHLGKVRLLSLFYSGHRNRLFQCYGVEHEYGKTAERITDFGYRRFSIHMVNIRISSSK